MTGIWLSLIAASTLIFTDCKTSNQSVAPEEVQKVDIPDNASRAYFGSGCFWCVEAIYESVEGVYEVISGYAGGDSDDPTYEAVGSGRTGHAEVVEVIYDLEVVSFATLVEVFYGSQDPTTIGQKPDFGSQYRSIIFYQNKEEKALAEAAKSALQASGQYDDPIVTEILPFVKFYPAEAYHQDFEKRNPNQSYVRAVSIPRLNRFKAKFPDILKKE